MNLYRAFATVGGLTMLSRVLGFVREIMIAFFFGAGAVADVFFVAFRFPNLFRRIFAEGAFNSAFIPLFTKKLESDSKSNAKRFAEDAMAMLLFSLLFLLALAEIFMPWLVHFIAPGFADDPKKIDQTIVLARIMFPYLLFVSLAALFSGVLNAMGRFAMAAAAPVALNVVLVGVLAIAYFSGITDKDLAVVLLSWGVFVAGVIQLLMLVHAAQKEEMALQIRLPRFTPEMKKFFILAIPGVLVGAVTQINIVVGQIIVSFQAGAVSILSYADRIYQLPLGIIGIAIGVVLLPDLSAKLRSGDMKAVFNSQNRSLEFSLLLTLPASVALFVAPEPIVRVLFERGAFTAEDSRATALALSAFAWGLPAFVMIKVFSPAFFAREDTRTPMIYAIIGMAVNTVLSFILFGYIGHVGIAVATTVSGWITASLLWYHLWRDGQFKADYRLVTTLGPILVSSVIMGCVIWYGVAVFAGLFSPEGSLLTQMFALAVLVSGGFAIYVALAHITGAIHIPTFIRMLSKRKSA